MATESSVPRDFAERHPDPVVRVAIGGGRGELSIAWANPAAAAWLARTGLAVGDRLPNGTRDELSTVLGNGDRRGLLLAGDANEPVWEFFLVPGPEPVVWLHARSVDDAIGEHVRAARRAKAAFLANTSHDLRTPLNAILGYTGLMREDRPSDPDLVRVEVAAQQLLGLIDDLLEVSRVEAGRIGLFVESFPLDVLVREVVDAVRPVAEARGVGLSFVAPSGVVRADRSKLRQILLQILDRSVRNPAGGGVSLEVSTAPGRLTATVLAPKLPPERAEASLDAEGAGALGLVLSRLLAGVLGGTLTSSAVGGGSAFHLVVPVEVGVVSGPVEQEREVVLHGPATGTSLVLVIDDDPASRDLLTRQLVREGHQVAAVADGEEGLRVARRLRPDVITLDLVMPKIDGWEVLRRLKADPLVGTIPVVVVSILDASGFGFALGASGFLTKPIDRDRLLAALVPFRSGGAARVLVVDDDPDQRALVRRGLSRHGWTVLEAADGAVALAVLEQGLPDVILLDLFMPGVDGFQVVDAVRSRPDWRHVPIVVVTALDLGAADHARLANRVQAVIGKRGGTALEHLLGEVRAVLPASHRPK